MRKSEVTHNEFWLRDCYTFAPWQTLRTDSRKQTMPNLACSRPRGRLDLEAIVLIWESYKASHGASGAAKLIAVSKRCLFDLPEPVLVGSNYWRRLNRFQADRIHW